MEGEEIGLVLARASELRSRINDGIKRNGVEYFRENGEGEEEDEEDKEDEEENLFGISDALESLEQQLASLQALQHQQRYERETVLSQIDRSRRVLLSKLREYKGKNWEIINEASLFAGETLDSDEWSPPLDSYPIKQKSPPSNESDGSNGVWSFVGWVVKTGIMIVGVLGAIRVAGYQPSIRKNGTDLEAGSSLKCPNDKFLVVENGVAHCVAKRRVTAPFESGVKDPNKSYGSG